MPARGPRFAPGSNTLSLATRAKVHYSITHLGLCAPSFMLSPAPQAVDGLLILDHRQDIAGGIFEPGDCRTAAAMDALFIRFNFAFVLFKSDATLL